MRNIPPNTSIGLLSSPVEAQHRGKKYASMDGLCMHETYSKASLITPSCISKILISHLYDPFAIPILLAAIPLEPQVTMTLCSVFRFWKTKLLLKNNRKVFKICIVLKFG